MDTLIVPTIHLNGTSKDELIKCLLEAIHAIYEAGRVLAATCPNGRDYYPQGYDAMTQAMDQHSARMSALRNIAADLEKIAEAID